MKACKTLEVVIDCGIATITFNRPEVRNAFNDLLLRELYETLRVLAVDESIIAVVITGAGSAFCSGADFSWMQKMVDYSYKENIQDAEHLAACLAQLNSFPMPTLARINGPVMGGGMGLVAVCDIAVAQEDAVFGFPEVQVGLAPATIGPYVLRKMGATACSRYFLTGERFTAQEALRMRLISEVVPNHELDSAVTRILGHIRKGGPKALAACKELVFKSIELPIEQIMDYTAELIAGLRVSAEGQEGLRASLAKRKPSWQEDRCLGKS